ncbi:MAG: hypothetical protein HRU26_13490 [Psychroserpens sp.]|nr:hypothetical protein [Psychroserpens sp.]
MKQFKLVLTLVLSLVVLSCSSDDDSSNDDIQNGFSFNGIFYGTNFAFVGDENTIDDTPADISITIANENPFITSAAFPVHTVFFSFEAVDLEPGTITVLSEYNGIINATLDDFDLDDGQSILEDFEGGLQASATTVTINSVSDTNISFSFSFTREDGEVLSGNYSGTYINISE